MGFYDCRCMVTGVSLKGADAALVLLQQAGDVFHPIALAIKGNYNRLGSIDNIDEDANADVILNFFFDKFRAGEFITDEEYLPITGNDANENLERLLGGFERNINDFPTTALLTGQPVVFALICRAVWDTLAKSTIASNEAPATWFGQLFEGVATAESIYRGNPTAVSNQLREMFAVRSFLVSRGIAWKPADNPCQHYSEEMRAYLAVAKRVFGDSELIMEALENYEREVRDLLSDE